MFEFCFLKLETPCCLKGLDDVSIAEVQLDPETDFIKLEGQRVRVHGDPFPAHTAWHVRSVVMTVKSFERL